MIVTGLIIAMGVCAIFQPTQARREAALIFTCVTMLHELLFYDRVGLFYYGTAALFDIAIIVGTANLAVMPRLVKDIHRVSLTSIVLNFSGWIMWQLYLSPAAYNLAFILLYAWVIVLLIKGERKSARGGRLDSWAYFLRFNSYIRGANRNKV